MRKETSPKKPDGNFTFRHFALMVHRVQRKIVAAIAGAQRVLGA